MNEWPEPLSPLSQDRSKEILSLAIRAGAQRRRRKLIVRGSIVAVATSILITVGVIAIGRRDGHTDSIVKHLPAPKVPPTQMATLITHHPNEIVIQRIATDTNLANKWAAPTSAIAVDRIDDDHLLNELAAAHVAIGIAYVDGHGRLLCRDMPPPKR